MRPYDVGYLVGISVGCVHYEYIRGDDPWVPGWVFIITLVLSFAAAVWLAAKGRLRR